MPTVSGFRSRERCFRCSGRLFERFHGVLIQRSRELGASIDLYQDMWIGWNSMDQIASLGCCQWEPDHFLVYVFHVLRCPHSQRFEGWRFRHSVRAQHAQTIDYADIHP